MLFLIPLARYVISHDEMTRSQGGVTNAADAGCHDQPAFHFSRLPRGAPEVIAKNTVIVSDSSRVLALAKEERQRNFNALVKRYGYGYGCPMSGSFMF